MNSVLHRLSAGLVFGGLVGVAALVCAAVEPNNSRSRSRLTAQKPTDSPKPNETGRSTRVDPEVETAALELVRAHLPRLKMLLERLRADHPRQYKQAINDLARSARRLEVAKNRDERLFEIEVETLKAQSAVNLLTAKLKVRDNGAERKQLRKAVERLHRSQITRAQYDVHSLQARLKRTEQQLKAAQDRLKTKRENSDQLTEKAYVGLLRKAGRQLEPDTDRRKSKPRPDKSPDSPTTNPSP